MMNGYGNNLDSANQIADPSGQDTQVPLSRAVITRLAT
jgi:hypothetical protein